MTLGGSFWLDGLLQALASEGIPPSVGLRWNHHRSSSIFVVGVPNREEWATTVGGPAA